jgi:Domain of unknown function (DUF4282)
MTTTPPPTDYTTPAPVSVPPQPDVGFSIGSFLSFRYMITPALVQVIYVLVAIIIVIARILTMVNDAPGQGPIPGLLIIIFGNLIWRVYMELVMLFFRINEGIRNIDRNTRR